MASEFVFPKPRDWNTFEDIVCDVYSRKFENQNFQRYGKSGQKQFGVDIVGVVNNSVLGIQCKHHPLDNISIKEIRADIKRADQFAPMLSELAFVTSADRDAKITSSVLTISTERKEQRKFAVTIKFWDDIYSWLSEYPDVLYKYFTKYFPPSELEKLSGFGLERNKITIEWPAKEDVLQDSIRKSMKEIAKIDPYKITLGISTFADVHLDGWVDLNVSLANCLSEASPDSGFVKAAKIFREVKSLITLPFYSKELFVHLQSRLPYALLFGWMFRKVTGYQFKVFSSNQIWVTGGLPLVFTYLQDSPPEMLNMNSSDLVFVLSISRDIDRQVHDYVERWADKPKTIVSYRYLTSSAISPALAMSMALEISQRIKSFKDNWALRRIHLFQAVPAGLAALIGFNLNSICPISLYYMDNNDSKFHIGGTLTNDM
jgi:hypothetical protein